MDYEKSNDPENAIHAYIITRTGKAYSDEGIQYIRDLVYNDTADEVTEKSEGIIAHMGADLLDARLLADMLRTTPDARVFISHEHGIGICPCGRDENGLPTVIRCLEEDGKKGVDSWTILMKRINEACQ